MMLWTSLCVTEFDFRSQSRMFKTQLNRVSIMLLHALLCSVNYPGPAFPNL